MVGADAVRKKLVSGLQFTTLYSGILGVQDGIAQHKISVSAASIPNFQDLSENNFLLNVKGITGNGKTGTNTGAGLTKSYDAATGIVKINVSASGTGGTSAHAMISCDLICVHVS
ncbi:MAG: hypothetical protein HDR71_15300 [Lachnospiraceae bacterium]|nr:hypothetical protein [Lachnospiraceae bacterium]